MNKIYLACSLFNAPPEFLAYIEEVKNLIKKDYQLLEFKGLNNGTPKEIYEYDTNCIKNCDLLIAECSYPSLGVGYEIAFALQNQKKVLAIAPTQAKVSNLIIGLTDPQFTFLRYNKIEELPNLIKEYIKQNIG